MPPRRLLPLIPAAALALAAAPALAEPSLVLLVRHAERAAEPKSDPLLTPAGEQRAHALAWALAHADVTSIITTRYQRTKLTAAPLAQARGLVPEVVEAQPGQDHVAAVVAAVRAKTGVVLVVGHSNTVPRIAAALSGTTPQPDFCETSFGHLLAVQGAGLARLRYGAPDAVPPQSDCQ